MSPRQAQNRARLAEVEFMPNQWLPMRHGAMKAAAGYLRTAIAGHSVAWIIPALAGFLILTFLIKIL
ncbi:MAG TPA: hypothetical protein VFS20_07130 [Longimicrobium sp.]|nr:hypothetical protein [Longimicrobium sp.]